jgi:hypothetical protein
MAKPKLTLFLDVVSPFAYLAFYVTKVSSLFNSQPRRYAVCNSILFGVIVVLN